MSDPSPSSLPPSHSEVNARRELTPRVIALGLVLSVVMGAANVYVGLKAGMTVSASIPAAVLAMVFFRYVFRDRSILEANQVQTCASAGESLAAGIIFTMPALVLIGYWEDFDFWTVTGVAFTGGLLGILFMIPMRRVFVEDSKELPYPEGIACAAVLRSGEAEDDEASRTAAVALLIGGLIGGLFKLLQSLAGVILGTLETARVASGRVFYGGADISPMLVGVGYIVRLNVAVLLFLGGAIGWLIAMPFLGTGERSGPALDIAWGVWSEEVRYIGVGAMVMGGLASIVTVRRGLVEAVRTLARGGAAGDESRRDLPSGVIILLSVVAIALVAALYFGFTGDVTMTAVSTVAMVIAAFFFTAVASYIVGLVGNSNSPVSGMTITAVLFAGGLLSLLGFQGTEAAVATLGVAAVVCCVACTSGDVCNDLKTGAIVGAQPRNQQIMQVLGVGVASLTMAPVLTLLHKGAGIGSKELPAPQAGLFKSLAEGFSGATELPWDLIGIGAAVGVVILLLDGVQRSRGSSFRLHLMPVAVGMYLPFGLALPILLGGVIAHVRLRGARSEEEAEQRAQRGVLFSSGIIAGEALMGVLTAGLAAAGIEKFGGFASDSATLATTVVAAAVAVAAFWVWTKPTNGR